MPDHSGALVGVLALQGDFREHTARLKSLGADVLCVRRPEELAQVSGLVIPGGESTVIDKLSRLFLLADPIKAAIRAGMPMYGTCAGLIMLAESVRDAAPGQCTFGGLDVIVQRNAFGSQTESFETDLAVPLLGEPAVRAVFIRAPIIEKVGEGVTVLAKLPNEAIVAVEQNNLMGTSFHPEMTAELRFHQRFYDRVNRVRFRA